MAGAVEPSLPALRGLAVARHHGRGQKAHHRAALPRRGELQRHQGTRSKTHRDVMAFVRAARVAGQARAGAVDAAERAHAEGELRKRQDTVHLAANSGTLRREPDAKSRNGPRAGDGPHPDAGHETDSSDAGPGKFLARALSENQIGAGAQISETFLAMTGK